MKEHWTHVVRELWTVVGLIIVSSAAFYVNVLLVIPLVLVAWVLLVAPFLTVRVLFSRELPISLGYFLRFGLQLAIGVIMRTVWRPWGRIEGTWPWPWNMSVTELRRQRIWGYFG